MAEGLSPRFCGPNRADSAPRSCRELSGHGLQPASYLR